jgi:DnaJ-class molecular chaperone
LDIHHTNCISKSEYKGEKLRQNKKKVNVFVYISLLLGLHLDSFYVILSENLELKGDDRMTTYKKDGKTSQCPYCKGDGYFQLRLGGSETCTYCSGSGRK